MPSATIDKLNQLKAQLGQCSNPTAALLLKRTIAKLESQLQIEQLTTGSTKATPKEAPKASQTITKDQAPAQTQVKATSQQQPTAKSSEPSTKHRDRRKKRQPLLAGNGTHRAWCWVPGIIRAQEIEGNEESLNYFLEFDGYQVPFRVKHRYEKLIKTSLDRPLIVKCYPQIIDGQLLFTQFAGTIELSPAKPEAWVLIGVWNADKQRVLVQRDQQLDPNRRIFQHSPLVSEDCLKKLEGRKLYRFECRREGVTVTVVGVECLVSEVKNSYQATP